MLLKHIWCFIKTIDVILLLILSLNKAVILEAIIILYCLIERLGLAGIVEDKIVLIKDNYLTVRNMTYAIYQK